MAEKRLPLRMSRYGLPVFSPHRHHRSKGLRTKHVLQLLLFVFFITWISFQFTHSDASEPVARAAGGAGSRRDLSLEGGGDANSLGRKGGYAAFGVEHSDQMDLGDEDDEGEGNPDGNESLQMDVPHGHVYGKIEESEGTGPGEGEHDDEDDNGDENEVAEDNNGGIEDINAADDRSIEELFNEDTENAENALPEVEDEQDDDASLEGLVDFEGEESLKDRKTEEGNETEDTRMLAMEGNQNSSFSQLTVDIANKTRRDNSTGISQANDRLRGLMNDVQTDEEKEEKNSGEGAQLDSVTLLGDRDNDFHNQPRFASEEHLAKFQSSQLTVFAALHNSSKIHRLAGSNV